MRVFEEEDDSARERLQLCRPTHQLEYQIPQLTRVKDGPGSDMKTAGIVDPLI